MTVTQSWQTQCWQKSGTAEFSVRPGLSATVVTADGELDAANANQLTVFVERCVGDSSLVILDLRDLDFFGTAGFSALHRINVVCSAAGVPWLLLAGRAANRVLQICDPDGTLPTAYSLPELIAAEAAIAEPRPLLQLVPQPR